MTCEHCEASVREEVSEIPGVTAIDVSADSGMLRIEAESDIPDSTVLEAIDEAGYAATRK